MRILEIGSVEAGVLKAFTEQGHDCTGIELSKSRVEHAKFFMKKKLKDGKYRLLQRTFMILILKKIWESFLI